MRYSVEYRQTTRALVKILVVEDNVPVRSLLAMYFREEGHDVSEAGNGREALDHLNREIVDVVVMDVEMPVMDGVTATQILRSKTKHASLPIIALTGQPHLVSDAKSIFNAVLAKPLKPSTVLFTLLSIAS
jgi:CheY-like chemotaxis protein